MTTQFGRFELVHLQKTPVLPNPRVRVVRTDSPRIGPGVDREQLVRHRGRNMHRAAVDTDNKTRDADEPDELKQACLVSQFDTISRASMRRLDLPTTTTRVGLKAVQISLMTALESDLSWPRAKGWSRIKGGYSSKRGRGSPLGMGHRRFSPIEAPANSASFRVPFHRVLPAIHLGAAIIKEARSFPPIVHAINLRSLCSPLR